MFPRFAPHEVAALPFGYYAALREYFLSTLPEKSDLPGDVEDIDFDKEVLQGGPT
jgi:hypothetical protein